MLLGEPGRTQGDLHFVLFGIPIRVHPMFWLVAALLAFRASTLPDVLIWVAALFLAILWHELGHAVVMRIFGFRPSIVLYGMGGLTAYNQLQSYGAKRLTAPRHILISLAGPMAGFLLAAMVVGGIFLSGHRENVFFVGWRHLQPVVLGLGAARLDQLINDLLFVCVFWGLINLLPVLPLDGGQVARDFLLLVNPVGGYRLSLVLSVLVGGGMAVIGAVQLHDWFFAIFFGLLAYESLLMLQVGPRGRLW